LLLYQKQMKDKSDRALAAQKSTQAAEAVRAGDTQKAAALYREAIAACPTMLDCFINWRSSLAISTTRRASEPRLNKPSQSIQAFALAQYQLGYLDSRDGDTAGAEQRLRLAIRASPGYVQAWLALAATLAIESRFPDALQAVDSALKIAPG
jgi:tetratricopeptide (TPR) repeat protein